MSELFFITIKRINGIGSINDVDSIGSINDVDSVGSINDEWNWHQW